MNAHRSCKWLAVLVALTMAFAVTMAFTPALAKPPKDKPGGGGGSDGGGDEPTSAMLIAPLDFGSLLNDINDLREIVGFMYSPSNQSDAAYWTVSVSNGEVETNLSILDGGIEAYSINNLGEIAGVGFGSAGNYVAVYWPNPSSSAIELPSLPGHDVSVALGINNDGLICGYVSKSVLDASGQPIPATYDIPSNRAVVWQVVSIDGTPIVSGPFELPSDGDGSSSTAHDLNDSDEFGIAQVIGYRGSPVSGEGGAFLWEVQSQPDGTVSVVTIPKGDGEPMGINNNGLFCGRRYVRSGVDALVWSGDTISILDRGKGKNSVPVAIAFDISDSGLIVGEAREDTSLGAIGRACIWDGIDGSLTYLDDYLEVDSPLASLDRAQAVNAFGDIIGYGSPYAFIAIPVSP